MTHARARSRSGRLPLFVSLAAALALGLTGCGGGATTATTSRKGTAGGDDPRVLALDNLHQSTDIATCRTALQQINQYLSDHPDDRPPALTDDQKAFLRQQFQLNDREIAEVGSTIYTPLDSSYLEEAYLLRDAADALDAGQRSGLDRATAAFGWVVRQVRLVDHPLGTLPPVYSLRLGLGRPVDRGLAFVALLQQLGLQGCLITSADTPDADDYWAAGAVVDGKIYVFDLRMGLPLPGPGGKGVATLADVRGNAEVLAPLRAVEGHPYDIAADRVKQAHPAFADPLNSMAPRMKPLEASLKDRARVKLARDPEAAFQTVQKAAGDAPVGVCRPALVALRSFLPNEEGGTDEANQKAQLMRAIVPLQLLPPVLQDMPGRPGQMIKVGFADPFFQFRMAPGQPRDQLLRGRYAQAAQAMIPVRDQLRDQEARLRRMPDWNERLQKWRPMAMQAQANLLSAQSSGNPLDLQLAQGQVEAVWKDGQELLNAVVEGLAAGPRGPEITYSLAQCMHEQAERLQARADASGKAPSEADAKALRRAWTNAASWWETYLQDFGNSRDAPVVRRWRARALAALGDRATAADLLSDLEGQMTGPEKTAHRYLAARLRESAP